MYKFGFIDQYFAGDILVLMGYGLRAIEEIETGDYAWLENTENYLFYVKGKGWCAAAELETGAVLRTQDGEKDDIEDNL